MNVRARSLNKMRKISKNDILYILALIQTDNYFLIKISQRYELRYSTNFLSSHKISKYKNFNFLINLINSR